jgi:hypothetical protein
VQDDISKRVKAGMPVDFPDAVWQRLKAVEEFVKTLTMRIETIDETVDLNGSDHEERLDRLERAPVESIIRRREIALSMAHNPEDSPEDVVIRAHAYLRFLEGIDPPNP